jgi:hypothetical protein
MTESKIRAGKMENFYIKIDVEYLNSLNNPIKKKLEQIIKNSEYRKKGYSTFIRLCPYCNGFSLLSVPDERISEFGSPKVCVVCGETNPFDKIRLCSEKASVLYSLSAYCAAGDGTEEDIRNERTLMEQSVVVDATGLEIFFRDIYSSGMNIKFVKDKYSLFTKFSNESKNDFINIDKTMKKFKTGLGIDLKKILDERDIKKINELFLKRNAIVHNNGFADNIFISQSGIKCKIGDLVPISDQDISDYSIVIARIVEKIENEFEKIIYPEIHLRIEDFE